MVLLRANGLLSLSKKLTVSFRCSAMTPAKLTSTIATTAAIIVATKYARSFASIFPSVWVSRSVWRLYLATSFAGVCLICGRILSAEALPMPCSHSKLLAT